MTRLGKRSLILTRTRVWIATAMIAIAMIAIASREASAQARMTDSARVAEADWWQIDRSITAALMANDLAIELARAASDPTNDAASHFRRVNLFVRAGHRDAARAALARFPIVSSPMERLSVAHMIDHLIQRDEWELARVALDRLPFAEPGYGHLFIERWARTSRPNQIDRWLARRTDGSEYWLAQRLDFRRKLGTVNALIDSLGREVRARPTDMVRVRAYLNATQYGRVDASWIADVVRPRLKSESYDLGVRLLTNPPLPRAALALLEYSLTLPYTAGDDSLADATIAHLALPTADRRRERERRLHVRTRTAMARALIATGQPDSAQRIVEALHALGYAVPSTGLSQLAGQVQRESGERVIEKRILEAEPAAGDSTRYWLTRAEYYRGRREHTEAIRAYERALAVTAPPTLGNEQPVLDRIGVMRSYRRFLEGNGSQPVVSDALQLVWREFAAAPPGSYYASHLTTAMTATPAYADSLATLLTERQAADRMWSHLSATTTWTVTDGAVVRAIVQGQPTEMRAASLARAERLAEAGDTSRVKVVGDVYLRLGEGHGAIRMLEQFVNRSPDGHDKELARLSILNAHLDHTGDWRAAETVLNAGAHAALTMSETTDKLAHIAILAAKAGAHDDAMRLWRLASNLDRADLRRLVTLAATTPEMRDALETYYRSLAATDRASWVPAAALKGLARR